MVFPILCPFMKVIRECSVYSIDELVFGIFSICKGKGIVYSIGLASVAVIVTNLKTANHSSYF